MNYTEELRHILSEVSDNANVLATKIDIAMDFYDPNGDFSASDEYKEECLDKISDYLEKLKVDFRVLENEIMIAKGVITRNDLIRP